MGSDGVEAYRLGRDYTVMPIPIDPERCLEIDAGPLLFIAEARWLSGDAVREHASGSDQLAEIDEVEGLQDSGLSVHVLDAADRREHLRFDCFENEPHYHYIRHSIGSNTVVRLDDIAEGDPLRWVLGRLRDRLPEMLEFLDLDDLANRVRAERAVVARSIDVLEREIAKFEHSGGLE